MLNKPSLALTIVFGVSAAVPFAASADAPSHFAPNEAGVVYHRDHDAGKEMPRAQVVTELETASKQRHWTWASRYGAPWPVAKTGPGKTREQVRQETLEAMRRNEIPSGEK